MAQFLMGRGPRPSSAGSSIPKNVPGRGDFVEAIKRGMKPKPKEPGQDYPKRVKVTT